MKDLELFSGTAQYTVNSAPVGLLYLENGSIICKSEYCVNGKPECIIVSSGENYCGDVSAFCVRLIIK